MEESNEPVAGMTRNYLQAISCILYFYERHLWHFAVPSVKRTKQIIEVQLLLVKLLPETGIAALRPSRFLPSFPVANHSFTIIYHGILALLCLCIHI